MKFTTKAFIISFYFILFTHLLRAQPGVTQAIRTEINAQVVTLFGSSFEVGNIINMDSVKGKLDYAQARFQDPNGLFLHCFLFTAHGQLNPNFESKGIVGVYKNDQIIWNSDTIITSDGFSNDELFGTYDLLGDGKNEIITTWPEGEQTETMWIFHWDGTNGVRLNALGESDHSAIIEYSTFDFVDVEGNGIWEIQAESGDQPNPDQPYTWTLITYKWDGQYYNEWTNAPQFNDSTFYPRDKINVEVKAKIEKVGGLYRYSYRIKSLLTSVQMINEIIIKKRSDDITAIGRRQGWSGFNGAGKIDWLNYGPPWGGFLYPTGNFIGQGEIDSSFDLKTSKMPYISNYYIQGYNKSPRGLDLSFEYNNSYSNSKSGKTLAPKDPPSPFDSLIFLDTLSSYTTQSRTLGWITEQSTAEKYTTLFDSAKAQLHRNAIRVTRATLDTVMANAKRDSSNTLSSEAYALIYFNTEYLLNQLPPPPPQYNLNINVNGNGTVTPSPEYTLYDSATTVTLTATPGTGYKFSGWSEDVSNTTNPLSLVMNSEKTITATFIQNVFVITATAGANGSITPSGDISVTYGANQSFTMSPNTGYHIADVVVDGSTAGAVSPYTFTNVTAPHTITASFAINTYTLSYTAGANGTISGTSPQTVNYNGSGTAVTAVPNTGYHFVSWSDAIAANPRTDVNVTANISVTANFAINTYTLTVNATNGTVTKNPNQSTYNYGTSVQLTAVPSTGYHFVNWTGDLTGSINPSSITMNANKTVTAYFAINTYTLTYTAGANGSVSGTSPQTVNYGASGTAVTAVPYTHYHFVNWSDGSTANPRTDANVTGNISVTANFAIDTYTLTIQITGSGTVTKTPDLTVYPYGTSVSLRARPTLPDPGQQSLISPKTPEPRSWRFDHWEGDLTGTQNPKSITMNGNKTVRAVFVAVY